MHFICTTIHFLSDVLHGREKLVIGCMTNQTAI